MSFKVYCVCVIKSNGLEETEVLEGFSVSVWWDVKKGDEVDGWYGVFEVVVVRVLVVLSISGGVQTMGVLGVTGGVSVFEVGVLGFGA